MSELQQTRIGFIARIQKGRATSAHLQESVNGLPLLSMEYLRGSQKKNGEERFIVPTTNDVLAEDRDILILWDGSNAGEFLKAKKGVLSSTLAKVCISNKLQKNYAFYALKTVEPIIKSECVGMGIPHVNGRFVKTLEIFTPSIEDQKRVTDFLDRETDRIDQLVEKKKLFLLKAFQRWEAVLSGAISGKNYSCERKDSEIRWIGTIPEHWKLWPVRYLTKEHRQGYYTTESYTDDGLPLVRITDLLSFSRVSFDNAPKVRNIPQTKEFLLKKGDFLFARTGGAGLFGVVENEEIKAIYASYLIRFRFSGECEHNFMKYYFLSRCFLDGVEESVHGGVNQNIHAENIKNQKIPLPPIDEQKAICEILEIEQSKIEKLKCLIDHSVKKLKELRAALITEAVTGQLDIKSWKKRGNTDKRLDNIEEAMRT